MVKKWLLSLVLAMGTGMAWADGLENLEHFVRTARSGKATFTQEVTAPAKDGQEARSRKSSGYFAFERPGRFKFVYEKPFAQTIVADGKTLWLYDKDLNQVTQRAQDAALASTPAALLAAAPDMEAVRAHFTLQTVAPEAALQWVLATPKDAEGQIKSVRMGFDGQTLAALEIVDHFGQRSVLHFSGLQSGLNQALPADTFTFTPPAGADVVRQ